MEYIPAKSIVNRTKDPSWFGTEYNMNIYRGCCHGCIYCDSRSDCYHNEDFDRVKAKADALRIIREFGLDGVIVHGTEGHLIPETIAGAGVPVICGPVISTRGKPELRSLERRNAAVLLRAGVEVAINTDAPEVPIDLLAASVAIAVKAGVPREKAIPLISGSAAGICGIGDRVGRIAPGLDGDILIFGEDPIGLLVKPEHIFVDGKQLR